MAIGGRRASRRLLVQALYQWQMGQDDPGEVERQFVGREEFASADAEHFHVVYRYVVAHRDSLDARIDEFADRPLTQIDPVEHAVLWLGLSELERLPDVPTNVVINEAIEVAKLFGAEDSYRYVNGILDRAAAGR